MAGNGLRPSTSNDGGSRSSGASSEDIPAPPSASDYSPDQLTLYGIKLNPKASAAKLWFADGKQLRLEVYSDEKPVEPRHLSFAVVYGYSFEGHCYRLDKPRMFIIEDSGMEASGCGFGHPYVMWSIRSRASLMEISLSYDLAEVLILDANLPGNRAPNTYGNDMQLAHRGGKLNRPGGA